MSPVLVSSSQQTEIVEVAMQAFLSKHGLNVYVRTSNSAVIHTYMFMYRLDECSELASQRERFVYVRVYPMLVGYSILICLFASRCRYHFAACRLQFRFAFVPILCAKTPVFYASSIFGCHHCIFHSVVLVNTHDFTKERTTCRLERQRKILNECG